MMITSRKYLSKFFILMGVLFCLFSSKSITTEASTILGTRNNMLRTYPKQELDMKVTFSHENSKLVSVSTSNKKVTIERIRNRRTNAHFDLCTKKPGTCILTLKIRRPNGKYEKKKLKVFIKKDIPFQSITIGNNVISGKKMEWDSAPNHCTTSLGYFRCHFFPDIFMTDSLHEYKLDVKMTPGYQLVEIENINSDWYNGRPVKNGKIVLGENDGSAYLHIYYKDKYTKQLLVANLAVHTPQT